MQSTRIFALAAAVALAIGCFLVVKPFISSLLWAAILVFCTWPLFTGLTDRAGLSRSLAAIVMVVASFLVLVLPIIWVAPTSRADIDALQASIEGLLSSGLPDITPLLGAIPLVGDSAVEWWRNIAGDSGALVAVIRPYAGQIAQTGLSFLLSILGGVAELLVAILLAFFFYRDGPAIATRIEAMMERLAGGPRAHHLVQLTGNVTRGVVFGLLGTAIAQGLMTFIGLWIAGVPRAGLLAVVAGVISVLPVGAPLVWLPAALWLFSQGSIGWGVFMLLYGALGISSVDNIIRPWFISKGADLPLLLTLLGALGGAIAFGLLGLFLGPVLLAVGYSVVKDWADHGTAGPPPA